MRFLGIIFIIPLLIAISTPTEDYTTFSPDGGFTYTKCDYVAAGFKSHYLMARKPRIEVYILGAEEWREAVKRYYGTTDPRSMSAFIINWVTSGNYEIYIPVAGAKDGGLDEHSLGHEFLHILKFNWHDDQLYPSKRCPQE